MEIKRETAKRVVSKVRSVSEETQTEGLCELRLLTKHDPDTRDLVINEESGCVTSYLAETLYSRSPLSQENAAATLLNLSLSSRDAVMNTPGLLDALSHALRNPASPSAVQSVSAALFSLLTVPSFRPIIGSKHDIVYALIDIIRNPNSPAKSNKDALKALFGVSLYPLNRATVIELGAVSALFSLVVKDGRVGILEDATAVIAQIAGCEKAEASFSKVSGIGVLTDLLDPTTGSSSRTKENAISALLNLVQCGSERVADSVRDLAVAGYGGIVYVASNGSSKGKSKAVSLLRVLDSANTTVNDIELVSSCSSSHNSS